jgi:molybdenum cofactor guanylyltransferase
MYTHSDSAAIVRPLGLVMAGGRSTRMGTSKALLTYHRMPQFLHTAALLAEVCTEVYVSCRLEQIPELSAAAQPWPEMGWQFLPDMPEWGEIGPMNGLLSAFSCHQAPWLVLGCDYPLLHAQDLDALLTVRQTTAVGTAFCPPGGVPEPLLAVYESSARTGIQTCFANGKYSLRYFLETERVNLAVPPDPRRLQSVDTRAQAAQIMKKF